MRRLLCVAALMAANSWASSPAPSTTPSPEPADPHQWLEAVMEPKALEWVRERSGRTERELQADARFASMRTELREVLDAADRIPGVSHRAGLLYNFWVDAKQPRGIWRRTTLEEYRKAEPKWEVLLDVDALRRAEGRSWVWRGAQCLGGGVERCMVSLSPGGTDAVEIREFDLRTLRFVEGGFRVPEAKTRLVWVDADTLMVATDTGPDSMTDSGYPRQARLWKRGTTLAQAPVVYEAQRRDVSVGMGVDVSAGSRRVYLQRAIDFYRSELQLWREGRLQPVPRPADAGVTFWNDGALLRLRSDWTVDGRTWPAGALVYSPLEPLLAGRPQLEAVFEPSAGRALESFSTTPTAVVLNLLQDVTGRVEVARRAAVSAVQNPPASGREPVGGSTSVPSWTRSTLPLPTHGTVSASALHDPEWPQDPLAESLLLSYTDFLTPSQLMLGRTDGRAAPEVLKSVKAQFDAQGMKVAQHFATSRDGTRVPYFVVMPRSAGDKPLPTLLYGYGGFQVSMRPAYSGGLGRAWLARGGVYVLANIRGGGEYGPAWHRAAILDRKQRSYDDFIAVAEDLVRRGVTTPAQLGIRGGSNGGLLVGAVMVQRPELFGAVVSQVPLLDMRRYHRLLAGASWMAEYGNPDKPEEWAWISAYSPYHRVPPASGEGARRLPPTLLVTSTRDDRVHPGHARKMAARLEEQGQPVLYWENSEGGHGGAADSSQRAQMQALEYAFLWSTLGGRR